MTFTDCLIPQLTRVHALYDLASPNSPGLENVLQGVGVDPRIGALGSVAVPRSGVQCQQEMAAAWVSRRKYLVNVETSVCQP